MDWSEEEIFKFLDLYKCEPHVWNPKHPSYKSRVKVIETWKRISSKMGKPITTLKHKKNSLMATFRMLRRKKLLSLASAPVGEDAYQPTWFAYKHMEDFLGDCYVVKKNPLMETSATWSETSEEETQDVDDAEAFDDIDMKPDITTFITGNPATTSTPTPETPTTSLKRPPDDHTMTTVDLHYLPEKLPRYKTVTRPSQHTFEDPSAEDECELYGKLLAIKLKRFSTYERHCLMHEIDGLFLKK